MILSPRTHIDFSSNSKKKFNSGLTHELYGFPFDTHQKVIFWERKKGNMG